MTAADFGLIAALLAGTISPRCWRGAAGTNAATWP